MVIDLRMWEVTMLTMIAPKGTSIESYRKNKVLRVKGSDTDENQVLLGKLEINRCVISSSCPRFENEKFLLIAESCFAYLKSYSGESDARAEEELEESKMRKK